MTRAEEMAYHISEEVKATQMVVFDFCEQVREKYPEFSRQEVLLSVCYAFVEFHLTGLMTAVKPEAEIHPQRREVSDFIRDKMQELLDKE